jgi:hypothetical protein
MCYMLIFFSINWAELRLFWLRIKQNTLHFRTERLVWSQGRKVKHACLISLYIVTAEKKRKQPGAFFSNVVAFDLEDRDVV